MVPAVPAAPAVVRYDGMPVLPRKVYYYIYNECVGCASVAGVNNCLYETEVLRTAGMK